MSIRTRRPRTRESFAVSGALALVLSPLAVAAAGPAAADDPEPEVVVSTDFEDESWEDHWEKSGNPNLAVVDEGGNKVLRVSDRAQDYDGIQTRTSSVHLEHDVVYTFTAKAKVDEDAGGPVSMRGVRKVWVGPGEDDHDYAWIGNTSVGTEWTEITGTFTLPAGSDATTALVYIGSDPAGGPYSYYLDDIVITKPATGPVVVLSSDFEDGETAPWEPRSDGNAPVAIAIHEGGFESDKSLVVTGRAANWHGVQTPINGLLEPGKTYQVSARVKLAEGEDPQNVKVTVQEERAGGQNWEQVTSGEVVVTDSDWVEITGAYTRPESVTGGVLYFEAAGDTSSFLVDDVVVLGPGGETWSPTPDPDFVPGGAVGASAAPVNAARGTGKVAALTFDDGPNGATTLELLDFLKDHGIQAVFCVIGQNIQAEGGAEVLRRIVADGHTLCNHSTDYEPMGGLSHAQVEAKLKANLAIIRDALDDPQAPVPYFRAPNGDWGVTGEVAAALGMQPLGLGNVLADWGTNEFDWNDPQPSVEKLEELLRAAVQPGAVVLVHDGGGPRENGVQAVKNVVPELLEDGWTFTLPRGGVPEPAFRKVFDFENGTLQGWTPRATAEGEPEVDVVAGGHESDHAAIVTSRVHQGQGIGYEVSGIFQPGVTYDVTAWVRFADGEEPGNVSLTLETRSGSSSPAYGTVGTFTGMSSTDWVQVSGALTMPSADYAYLYFETEWADGAPGNTSTFLVDDIVFQARQPGEIQDLTPLKDTVPFPMGVAIDNRETVGGPSQLLLKHFDQVTAENHMKVEAWYTAPWQFQPHEQALQIMDFAQENGLRVYGHVLVWHSQTPDWFFQDEEGKLLSSSEEDKATMRERLREHIFNVAEALADRYGPFGSATNPLVAWDVVNEVVDDSPEHEDGLRRSYWYQILGEEFIHLAFRYADEAFNDVHAAEGVERPVKLFINDYNTEQSGKQDRYFALVNRLLDAEVPIDGVGHQFHVNLAMPTANLEAAIERFAGLGLLQAVTELDVTVLQDTEAQIREQGYYYQRAFDIFRRHADELFSVTVWGLTDGRSWRSTGRPLLFDDELQAKPAYFGAAGSEDLPPLIRQATVFRGDEVSATAYPPSHGVWDRLRRHEVGDRAGFQLRWAPDRLVAYVEVEDATKDASDAVTFEYAGGVVTVPRSGAADVTRTVEERAGGWATVVELPVPSTLAQGGTTQLDVRVTDGASTTGWNSSGELGLLSLVEPLSYTQVLEASQAPEIDGEVDEAWAEAVTVTTGKFTQGSSGATAEVRTLWKGSTLYVLAEVTDPVIDLTASNPWEQDSVEVFVDAGNAKAGGYRYDDTQIRVNAANTLSFGTGDEAFQRDRVTSATSLTDTGYRVELAVDLLEYGGAGTFHGLDFQVNDASGGVRSSVVNWADPTGNGYQSTSRWGVGKLVTALEDDGPVAPQEPEEPEEPAQVVPTVTSHPSPVTARLGSTVTLRAKASGTPRPSVQWQSRAKGSSTWKNVKGATSTTLKVKVTKKVDGTSYRAVFTNPAGTATTKAAKVTVKPVKARITKHPRSASNVRAGTKVRLTVRHTGAYPKAKVRWEQRKPGSGTWTRVKGASGRTLVVVASHKSHGVKYRAVVSNKAGTVRSKAATVKVRPGAPAFVKQPRSVTARAGRTVTFTAQVAARPAARLQWYAKAPGATRWTPVAGARSATLKVRATQARNGTRYTLIAYNAHGWTGSRIATLTVRR